MKRIFFTLSLLCLLLLNGCITTVPDSMEAVRNGGKPGSGRQAGIKRNFSPTFSGLVAGLASQIRNNMRNDDLSNWPCVMTTIVDIDNLEASSRFGRTLSENLGSEIFRQGGRVLEIRSGKAFYLEPGTGELVLSRDVENLAGSVDARAVLTGTYSVGAGSVSVNIRLLDLRDRSILSVATAEIARTAAIDAMLSSTGSSPIPTTYDRMP